MAAGVVASPTIPAMPIEPASPINVEPIVSDKKLDDLLRLQAEYPELDFKQTIDVTTPGGVIEFAKDVGAMQVRGGYIVGGADDNGNPTGDMDDVDPRAFDEANLVPMLRRYLPDTLELRTRFVERDGHKLVLIYVAPNPAGCAVFRQKGAYVKPNGKTKVVFRAGEIFWRDGTRSVTLTQRGFEEVMRYRLERARNVWLREQQEQRREEFEQRAEGDPRVRSEGPDLVEALGIDLSLDALIPGVIRLARSNDLIGLRQLLNHAVSRARELLEEDDFEEPLGEVVDKLACVAAALLHVEQFEWFERIVDVLAEVYDLGIDANAHALDYSTQISPTEKRVRLWLLLIRRVYALGGLAVRLRQWSAVRTLVLQRPGSLGDYYTSWLRHGLTMAARAGTLRKDDRQVSLLEFARDDVERLECLRLDGVGVEEGLTSIVQFDILSALVSIATAQSVAASVFYTNFAPFRTERVEPIVVRLLGDDVMRAQIFPLDDDDLALALKTLGDRAENEGFRFSGGFWGFHDPRITEFVETHLPAPES